MAGRSRGVVTSRALTKSYDSSYRSSPEHAHHGAQAGWMGKGKKPGEERSEHVSRPLTSLKDPSLFGPPPKNVNYHGGAALPNEITPHTSGLGAPLSQTEIQRANQAVQRPTVEELEAQQEQEQDPPGPPLPYRADRTGLQTSHLPPPPTHRAIASTPLSETVQPVKPNPRLPPRLPSRQASTDVPSAVSAPPPSYEAVIPPPTSTSTNSGLNTSALNRLGHAGISVPGFGIGKSSDNTTSNPWKTERIPSTTSSPPVTGPNTQNPWKTERSQNTTSPPPSTGTNTLSELQSRFSRMNSSSAAAAPAPASASTPPLVTAPTSPQPQTTPTPPTWQQSQSALRTASNFHQNPSSISAADAQSAAATAQAGAQSANAFREKHAGTINVAGQRAQSFNQKYKVQSRFEKFLDKHAPLEGEQNQQQQQQGQSPVHGQGIGQAYPPPQPFQQPQLFPATQIQSPPPVQKSPSPELSASITRKPPPPPPPKKPRAMHGSTTAGGVAAGGVAAAPPVPLGTKPGYT